MSTNKLAFTLYFLCLAAPFFGQELSFAEYLRWTLEEHPVAKQAALIEPSRQAQLLQAKGLFDPKLQSKFKEKFFNANHYYSSTNVGLEMKTPYAISLVSDYDLNAGSYLNPDDYTSDKGLFSVGVAVPILKGLFFDEQRLTKQRAVKLNDIAQVEFRLALNELLYQSAQLYNQWFIAEERLRLTSELVNLSEIRFKAIKQRFEGGDRSGMDTLEAFAQVQNRQIQLLEAKQEMLKSRIALVAFINDQDSTKFSMLNLSIYPSKNFKSEIRNWSPHFVQMTQINNHPEVLVTETKIDILTLEQRWKKEKLKPKLDIEYRFLQKDFSPLSPGNYSTNNYTWGMQFSAPLFMREARGDLKMQALKITDANLGLEWKKNQIDQKSQQLQATFDFVQEQLKLSEQLANLYQTLLSAENVRFQNGESSVFLLNQRENTFFENQLKLLDFTRKDFQTRIDQAYLWVLPYERIAN